MEQRKLFTLGKVIRQLHIRSYCMNTRILNLYASLGMRGFSDGALLEMFVQHS